MASLLPNVIRPGKHVKDKLSKAGPAGYGYLSAAKVLPKRETMPLPLKFTVTGFSSGSLEGMSKLELNGSA